MGSSQYENNSARINQPATHRIYWDNTDRPGPDSLPFNGTSVAYPYGLQVLSSTSTTFTIGWNALSTAAPDGDFYSYRIYFRQYDPTDTAAWTMIDRDATGYSALGTATTVSATITGLKPITTYEYILSAVDVFGNEVTGAPPLSAVPNYRPYSDGTNILWAQTGAFSVTVQLTDGITTYGDATFTDNLASTKPVVRSAITVIATIQGDTLPTSVNLIAAGDGAAEVNNDILDASVTREIFTGMDISGNRWKFIIPNTSSLLTVGTSVRFILEVNQTSTSHVDHTPATDHTDNEFRFYVSSAPAFTPWPTRILNNLITDKHPVAYPSNYLSDDANVTIKVYDIKGRPVAILLDGAFRKGGQNIKENGWRGHNKSNKMMGVGLYYVHFQAKRASDNKVILDQIKKVVIAK